MLVHTTVHKLEFDLNVFFLGGLELEKLSKNKKMTVTMFKTLWPRYSSSYTYFHF